MSEDQLSSLLATLKVDAEFREKLQGAVDLDSALALANEGLLKKLPASRFDSSQETGVQEAHLLAMQ